MNILKIISTLFLGSVTTYVLKLVYNNRYEYLLKVIKYGTIVKKNFSKCKNKIKKDKQNFVPRELIITGEYIKYRNLKLNNLLFEKSIQNVSYYTGLINFILTYEFNDKKYYFIRKNYLINCIKDLKDFVSDLTNNNEKEKDSRILNAEMLIENNNNNITKDITNLIRGVEGYNKDFNLDCVYIRDLYFFLNKQIDFEINEENEKTIKINIIDNLADEHIFRYDDKLSF